MSDMKIHSFQSGTPDDFGKEFDACDISTLGLGEKTAMSLRLAQAAQEFQNRLVHRARAQNKNKTTRKTSRPSGQVGSTVF